jgi:hypothetical protein
MPLWVIQTKTVLHDVVPAMEDAQSAMNVRHEETVRHAARDVLPATVLDLRVMATVDTVDRAILAAPEDQPLAAVVRPATKNRQHHVTRNGPTPDVRLRWSAACRRSSLMKSPRRISRSVFVPSSRL